MIAKHQLWLNGDGGECADFSKCFLDNYNFPYAQLQGANFDGAILVNVSFPNATLTDGSFQGTKFQGCDMRSVTATDVCFKGAIFRDSDLAWSSFKHCNLKNAVFTGCELEYGVPQDRTRVIIVGELTNGHDATFTYPERLPGPKKTVREAISDLMDKDETMIANHKADKLSTINLRRIQAITEGQGRDSLPEELQLECQKNNSGHRHLDTYGRMAWNQPAPTITARFDSFSRGRFGHPVLDRTITLREGARLQTFPDDFEFLGTKVEVAKQIGNAVPPLLAEHIAAQVKACLDQRNDM